MDIHSLARTTGAALWFETQLFETTGAWARSLDDNSLAVAAGRWCAMHGQHIDRLGSRMPSVTGIDPDAMVAPATTEHSSAASALRAATPGTAGASAAHVVMLRLLDAHYRAARLGIDPRIDGPTARLLDDLVSDCAALLRDPLLHETGQP